MKLSALALTGHLGFRFVGAAQLLELLCRHPPGSTQCQLMQVTADRGHLRFGCADQMMFLPEAKHWRRIPDALSAPLTVHLNDEIDRIVGPGTCRQQGLTCLQISPTQWAIDAVQNEYDAPFGSLDSDFHEALKKGAWLKSNTPDKASI
jgi:hypothetical protein